VKIAIVAIAIVVVTLGAGLLGKNLGGNGVARAGELDCQEFCPIEEPVSPFVAFRQNIHRQLLALEDEFYRPYRELDAELRRMAGHPSTWR
jgi:hypothetical protein